MLRIGEFSKLSHITIKALRFYEKEGLLMPVKVDRDTGYRYYETNQLEQAAKIKAYRQLDFSIEEIKEMLEGKDVRDTFQTKLETLQSQREQIDLRLSIIKHLLEEKEMKYQVIVKEIPECIVYYSEIKLHAYSDMMQYIPAIGEECRNLNPQLKCAEPLYEFCEYLDGEYKEHDVTIRHNQAVCDFGKENDQIKFKKNPATKVLSIFHKGPYDKIGEAYAFLMKYINDNGYKVDGLCRECYIDGIWNKESVEDWLTEIQCPIQ